MGPVCYAMDKPSLPVSLGEFLAETRFFPAVYLLYNSGVVVYVGQSVNLTRRIETHLTEGVKLFDAVAFIACPVSRLLNLERCYINEHSPKYNSCRAAAKAKRESGWGHTARSFCGNDGVEYFPEDVAAAKANLQPTDLRALEIPGAFSKRKPRSKERSYFYPASEILKLLAA